MLLKTWLEKEGLELAELDIVDGRIIIHLEPQGELGLEVFYHNKRYWFMCLGCQFVLTKDKINELHKFWLKHYKETEKFGY